MEESINYDAVADLYDHYVQITLDVPFFVKEAGKVSGEVLELMAGTGRVSLPLIDAGVRLTCVDNSAEMLARLRAKLEERGLSAEVLQMDVRQLALGKKFAMVFIPFHSFSELLGEEEQYKVLAGVYTHLTDAGHFICTLHNPEVRRRRIDGQLRLWGKHPLDGRGDKLLLWGLEKIDSGTGIVEGVQLIELYDRNGVMQSRRLMETRFCLPDRDEFEAFARSAGFRIVNLYGDYSYAAFDQRSSPFMIWVMEKNLG